jgi:hypothetical protein
VPAIGHLQCLRSPLPSAIGISVGSISGNDLHTWMRPQPAGQGLGLAVGQQINRATPLQVDQDRAIALSLAPRSGKEGISLPLPPLRTVRVGFPTYGSSLSKRPGQGTRFDDGHVSAMELLVTSRM